MRAWTPEDFIPKRCGDFEPHRFQTLEGFQEAIRGHSEAAASLFMRQGKIDMHFVVFCHRDIRANKDEPCLYMVQAPPERYTALLKDSVAQIVQATCDFGRAEGYVMISETWVLKNLPRGEKPPNDFSTDPRREEVLFVMAEHRRHGSIVRAAPITETRGKRTLGPWNETKSRYEGRFARLVGPEALGIV